MNDLKIGHIRCEYRRNPIGIGIVRPRFNWCLVPGHGERDVMQSAYQVQVVGSVPDFTATLWDSGKIISDRSVHIEYGGEPVKPRSRYYYRVRIWDNKDRMSDWSDIAYWETGLLAPEEWTAQWITCDLEAHGRNPEACHMLRKTFQLHGQVKEARIYATSLGVYELELNGRRVGDDLLTPGWTSYNKRLQTQTYDVSSSIREGANGLGIQLADGWYKGNLSWEHQRNVYGHQRAALIQLHLIYEDGREEIVASDETWKAETGPITYTEIYHGETYDARLERAGWSTAEYDDCQWLPVSILDYGKQMLVQQENEPTRIVQEIKPIGIILTPAGETVLDFGQNMVGWVEFTVRAEAGKEVVLKHAEVLDKDGNFYVDNLRTAKQTNRYICRGSGGAEQWEPRFTFQGFRFVSVEGWPGEPDLHDFTGKVIYTDMEPAGSFECSDDQVNQLQRNIVWGQRGNFLDIPTDCPQRNERLGWTGDAQVFIRTASYNMNVASFFSKWLRDLRADQRPDGGVPYVIPDALPGLDHSSSAWGDAAIICPWTLYVCYGDERVLEEQYDSMKAWVEYIRRQGGDELLWNTGGHFGDWLALDAKENSYVGATPTDLIATAFYAYSTELLSRTAAVLNLTADAEAYRSLHRAIVDRFNHEFVTPGGRLVSPTQTAHALALAFGLVQGPARIRIANTLAQLVKDAGNKLTTGFVGTPYLCHALTRNGYHDLACRLVLTRDYPSWLYSVARGATTLWEHWDGIKEDGSFWNAEMNSFNHYAYGSIGDWLYRTIAGIDTDEERPGYKHARIRPFIGEGFDSAAGSLKTMYGTVCSAWKLDDGGRISLDVEIPANTTATVLLPGARLEDVQESGSALVAADGIRGCEQTDDGVRLDVASGMYSFQYRYAGT